MGSAGRGTFDRRHHDFSVPSTTVLWVLLLPQTYHAAMQPFAANNCGHLLDDLFSKTSTIIHRRWLPYGNGGDCPKRKTPRTQRAPSPPCQELDPPYDIKLILCRKLHLFLGNSTKIATRTAHSAPICTKSFVGNLNKMHETQHFTRYRCNIVQAWCEQVQHNLSYAYSGFCDRTSFTQTAFWPSYSKNTRWIGFLWDTAHGSTLHITPKSLWTVS